MPTTDAQWAWFTFYTLGSIGGVCFLGYLAAIAGRLALDVLEERDREKRAMETFRKVP